MEVIIKVKMENIIKVKKTGTFNRVFLMYISLLYFLSYFLAILRAFMYIFSLLENIFGPCFKVLKTSLSESKSSLFLFLFKSLVLDSFREYFTVFSSFPI